MTAVRREVEIVWGGERLRFVPDFEFLMRVEARGILLSGVLANLHARRFVMTELALLVSLCLEQAGRTVAPDEVFAAMLGEDAEKVLALAQSLVAAIFPAPDPKKPAAPPAAPGLKKVRRPR